MRQLTGAHDLQENHLPKVHARATDFSSPGHTPVRQLSFLSFLPWHHVLSTARYGPQGSRRMRRTQYSAIWALIDVDHRPSCIKYNPGLWPIQASLPNPVQWVVDLDGGASARNASMEYEGIDARARP